MPESVATTDGVGGWVTVVCCSCSPVDLAFCFVEKFCTAPCERGRLEDDAARREKRLSL